MTDTAPIRLTPSLRVVLRVMARQHGSKLSVAQIAREARLSAPTTRAVLTVLGRARMVQHVLLPSSENRPPRAGYWLTGAGIDVAQNL